MKTQRYTKQIKIDRKSIVKNALIKHGISVREHTMSEKFKNELTSRTKHNIPGNFFYSIKSSASIRGYEFDLTKGYLSVDAPLARHLLGKRVDDEFPWRFDEHEVMLCVTDIQYL